MINIKKYLPVTLATMAILGSVTLATSADELAGKAKNAFSSTYEMRRGPKADVQAALDANDYAAWMKAESQNGQLPERLKAITKDNFAKFVSMQKLMKDGKPEEAKAIADELGLKMGMGMGKGGQAGPRLNEAAQTAIANGDYAAWVKAESQNGQLPERLKVVTAENFPKFTEAHLYRKQGAELLKKSDDLMKEIGLKQGRGFGKGMMGHRGGGKGMSRGTPMNQAETPTK